MMRRSHLIWAAAVSVCLAHTSLVAQSITRDSLRAELPLILDVLRVPTPTDSVWVVAVPRSTPQDLAVGRFAEANPFFVTYLLENAPTFRFDDFLNAVPSGSDAKAELYTRLAEEAPLMDPLYEAVHRFVAAEQGASVPYLRPLPAEDVLSLASRFVRLDASPDGQPQLSLCAKSSDIRERPFDTSVALEAWIYSMIRPGVQAGDLSEAWSLARAIAIDAAPIQPENLMTVQRQIWESVQAAATFRSYMTSEMDRRREYLPFEVQR